MSNIICLTVSTNYEDLLEIIIPQNIRFFKEWYIITKEDDIKTIDIINTFNYPNIHILYFDFNSNAIFNKGGAIKYGQEILYNLYPNDNMLILDSDIYLPDNFMNIYNSLTITDNTLYGPEIRYDYRSHFDFIYDYKKILYPGSNKFFGFFQLFKCASKYFYQSSYNCEKCDIVFKTLFPSCVTINGLIVKHLGVADRNWNGRINKLDFI